VAARVERFDLDRSRVGWERNRRLEARPLDPRAGADESPCRGAASLSNSEIVPSGKRRASCCHAKRAPGPSAKSLRFPPSRQMIRPVRRSSL
jgi:hypothetical protein